MILEEYGKWINETTNSTMAQRNEYYAAIANEAELLMRAADNSNLMGTGQPAPDMFSCRNNAAQVSWACPSSSVLQMAGFCTAQVRIRGLMLPAEEGAACCLLPAACCPAACCLRPAS